MAEISKLSGVAIANVAKVDAVTKANIANINDLTVPSAGIDAFTITIDTSLGDGTATFEAPVRNSLNVTIYWGDGTSDTITSNTDPALDHTYSTGGTYDVVFDGTFLFWSTSNTADQAKVIDVKKWSTNFPTATANRMSGFTGLVNDSATDYPTGSSRTDWNSFYSGCTSFNGDISNWDVSTVQNLSSFFQNAPAFNQNIGGWTTSALTNIAQCFDDCTAFNQNIGSWDVSGCTSFSLLFRNASAFNQDIGSWDTSSVSTIFGCFFNASNFDQDIGDWNISSLTNANLSITTNFSTANYDALLIGWAAQAPSIQSNVTLSSGPKYSSAAVSARNTLTSTYNWSISDQGLQT